MSPNLFVRRGLPRLVTVAGVLAICLGANQRSCTFFGINSDDLNPDLSFRTELELRNSRGGQTDTFALGETVTMVLTVRNLLETEATVQFPTSQQFDFVVLRPDSDTVVWRWSDDNGPFTQAATELDFAAGETKTFTRSWNQTDSTGAPLAAGTFEARGVLMFSDFTADPRVENQQASEFESLTIR
jgi:Intracellular proteinase inhibitor